MMESQQQSELEFPVAYCQTCDDTGPVVVTDIRNGTELSDGSIWDAGDMAIVYCPGCMQILNLGGDLEVRWYTQEELPKACGWRVDA